jgi:hypothetical protein
MTTVLELTDVTFRRNGKQIINGISLTVGKANTGRCLAPTVRVRARCRFLRCAHIPDLGHRPRHHLQHSLTVRDVVLTGIPAQVLDILIPSSGSSRCHRRRITADTEFARTGKYPGSERPIVVVPRLDRSRFCRWSNICGAPRVFVGAFALFRACFGCDSTRSASWV